MIVVTHYAGYPQGLNDNDGVVYYLQVRVRGDSESVEKISTDLYKFFKKSDKQEVDGRYLIYAPSSVPCFLSVDERKRVNYVFNLKVSTCI